MSVASATAVVMLALTYALISEGAAPALSVASRGDLVADFGAAPVVAATTPVSTPEPAATPVRESALDALESMPPAVPATAAAPSPTARPTSAAPTTAVEPPLAAPERPDVLAATPPPTAPSPSAPTQAQLAPAPPPTVTPVPAPPPPAIVVAAPPTLNDREQGLVDAMNARRAAAGLPALEPTTTLTTASRSRSQDMLANNYFAHTSPTGQTWYSLLAGAGVRYAAGGENLAKVSGTATASVTQAIEALMASPTHRANIMNAAFHRVGVGVAGQGDVVTIFTTIFTDR